MTGEANDRIREVLSGHHLLQHLADDELEQLLVYARLERYTAGQMLFKKGDPGTSLMAILAGRVKISTLSADGEEVVLNILGPGQVFGEIALLDGKARTADATAIETSELVALDRGDFLPFLDQHSEIATRLIAVLCERLRWVSDIYDDVVFINVPARLAKKLLILAREFGVETSGGAIEINIQLSQTDLGKMMGKTRESVNKVMREWQDRGLIRVENGYIKLLQPDAIEGQVVQL